MAVLWNKFHIGFDRYGKRLYIGRGEIKNDKIKWDSKSEDRTEEIVEAVMLKMKACVEDNNDPNKPFHCYRINGIGKLIFLDDRYRFDVRPEPRFKR